MVYETNLNQFRLGNRPDFVRSGNSHREHSRRYPIIYATLVTLRQIPRTRDEHDMTRKNKGKGRDNDFIYRTSRAGSTCNRVWIRSRKTLARSSSVAGTVRLNTLIAEPEGASTTDGAVRACVLPLRKSMISSCAGAGWRMVSGASFGICTLRRSGLTVAFVPLPADRATLHTVSLAQMRQRIDEMA